MDASVAATATLLSVPSVSPADRAVCADILTCDTSQDPNVLHVDFVRTPRDRVRHWQQAEHPINELAILKVETFTRSASAAQPAEFSDLSPVVETVKDPSNLTQFGMAFTKCLERRDESGNPVRVCFHSISAFLHDVDLSVAFKFLNVLRGQLSQADARGHFHIEPNAHDQREIQQLQPLFDAVVEADVNGTVEVTSR